MREHASNRFSSTSLRRDVLAMNRSNRFSGLLPTFKTAEAVTNVYLHLTPVLMAVHRGTRAVPASHFVPQRS